MKFGDEALRENIFVVIPAFPVVYFLHDVVGGRPHVQQSPQPNAELLITAVRGDHTALRAEQHVEQRADVSHGIQIPDPSGRIARPTAGDQAESIAGPLNQATGTTLPPRQADRPETEAPRKSRVSASKEENRRQNLQTQDAVKDVRVSPPSREPVAATQKHKGAAKHDIRRKADSSHRASARGQKANQNPAHASEKNVCVTFKRLKP